MSNLREAAQQALVVMGINQYTVAELAPHKVVMQFNDAMSALTAALAEPEQEPCGYDETTGLCTRNPCCYTAPPKRKPLTKQEIWKIHDLGIPPTEGYVSPVEFARAIEAAHGIKG